MDAEQTQLISKGDVLIPTVDSCPIDNLMGSAIQCLEAGEKGLRFKRMNLCHPEEFFMGRDMLATSKWRMAPPNAQLRFL